MLPGVNEVLTESGPVRSLPEGAVEDRRFDKLRPGSDERNDVNH